MSQYCPRVSFAVVQKVHDTFIAIFPSIFLFMLFQNKVSVNKDIRVSVTLVLSNSCYFRPFIMEKLKSVFIHFRKIHKCSFSLPCHGVVNEQSNVFSLANRF